MRRRSIPILLGLAFVLVLLAIRIADPYPVRLLREIAFDTFQQIKPRAPIDAAVRIADIDEASLAAIGQWPWSRDVMAQLTARLTEMGAASIVFDVLFPEPDRTSPAFLNQWLAERGDAQMVTSDGQPLADYDAEFAAALGNSPSVLGFGIAPGGKAPPERGKAGIAVVGSSPIGLLPAMSGVVMSLPALQDAAAGMGSITLEPGSLQTVRRLPLLWSNGGEIFPSLSVEALRVALGQDTLVVFGDQAGQGTVTSVRIGDFEVPTNTDGSFWMYYRPPAADLYVSVKDILGGDPAVAERIAGHIVLIGTSATGLLDIRGTALGIDLPGVEIHAQAIEQMVGQSFLSRADWLSGLEILAFLVIGVGVVLIIMRSGPWVCLVIGGVLAVALIAVAWTAFVTHGLLVDPTFPLGGSFIVYSAMIFFQFTISDADKRLVRRAFSNYVDPDLLAEIERRPDSLKLGGEIRELSVLFLDIRGFTTLSEGAEPAALVHMLNTLFGALGTSITENYGTIDKFIGDSIMAFWNAPVDVANHPLRACLASLGMRETLVKLNADGALKLQDGRAREVAIGIGISTGPALVGNLGLESRFDYSCIGNTVNVASRVEGASKTVGYDIVVSGSTREQSAGLAFLAAGSISLKGKTSREDLHLLVGDETLAQSPAFKALEDAHGRVVADMVGGRDPAASIAGCLELIGEVDPRLDKFYTILPERAEDFPAAAA
jgi:adenylate cyclase